MSGGQQTNSCTKGNRIRTLTSLLWGEDVEALLYLCEIPRFRFDHNASQYERFCAICDAFACSKGHPTKARCQALLKTILGIEIPLLPENAEQLWRITSERLLLDPIGEEDVHRKTAEAYYEKEPIGIFSDPQVFSPIDCSFLLENTEKCTSWKAWERWAEDRLEKALGNKAEAVLLELPEMFYFVEPNLYAIETLLKSECSLEQSGAWRSQMARFLSGYCIKKDQTLCLRILCDGEEASKLLRYLQGSVGIGKLSWSAPKRETQEALVNLQEKPHSGEWYWSLSHGDTPSDDTWTEGLCRYATLYPVKRLSVWNEK